MLRITNLNAGYEDFPVLRNVDLELQPGTISVLMGPNGAGKSTLLRSIFNLVKVTAGEIKFLQKDVTKLPTHKLLELGLAYVPQGRVNFGTLTVKENLLLGGDAQNLEKIFQEFPFLGERQNQYAFSLSGGQQQILALARALMHLPKLLLLDEPSLGLAPKLVKEIFRKTLEIKNHFGVTVLVVEHNLKSVLDIADYGYVMVNGEIIAHDSCAKLKGSAVLRKVFVGEYE